MRTYATRYLARNHYDPNRHIHTIQVSNVPERYANLTPNEYIKFKNEKEKKNNG